MQVAKHKLGQSIRMCDLPGSASSLHACSAHSSRRQHQGDDAGSSHACKGSDVDSAAAREVQLGQQFTKSSEPLQGPASCLSPNQHKPHQAVALPYGVVLLQLELIIPLIQTRIPAKLAAHMQQRMQDGRYSTAHALSVHAPPSTTSLAWAIRNLPSWRPSPAAILVLEALAPAGPCCMDTGPPACAVYADTASAECMGVHAAAHAAVQLLEAHQRTDQQRAEHFRCGVVM